MLSSTITSSPVYGLIGALGVTLTAVISLIIYILLVIAYWKIFTKAGEKGWKSIIPIYNIYVQYKLTWKTAFFWIMILSACIVTGLRSYGISMGEMPQWAVIINAVLEVVILVIDFGGCLMLSRSFGHGVGYTLGIFFLPNIFTLILGFGRSRYKGNASTTKKASLEA